MNPIPLKVPQLFLSTQDSNWEDILLLAYDEPDEMEGWLDPVLPNNALMLMLRGTMLLESSKVYTARAGDWFLRPVGSVGGEIRWKNLTGEAMQTLHIQINQKVFARLCEENGLQNLNLIGKTAFQDALLSQLALALFEEAKDPSPLSKLYAQSATQMISSHLLRHYATDKTIIRLPEQGLNRRQLKQLKDYIEDNLSDDISVEDLATLVHLSPYHFLRLFRLATGQSPYQYILRRRVEHAKQLLLKTKLPLAQVALESGFAHQSHLSRVFKQHLGLTPRDYRQKL